jgi:hypothetical protein
MSFVRRSHRVFAAFALTTAIATFPPSASTRPPTLVVTKRALLATGVETGYAEYGLVLRNPTSRDALDVAVTVIAKDSSGDAVVTDTATTTLVPAGRAVVVTGQLVSSVFLALSRMSVRVRVGLWAVSGRGLPPVHGLRVRVDVDSHAVGWFTNPYARSMPSGAYINALFLDGNGRIMGVDTETSRAVVSPHATAPFDLSATYNTAEQLHAVRSAMVTIDPCGYDLDTPACPIPGANG